MHQNRNTITKNHLPQLQKFLRLDGWTILPITRNPYEVMRASKQLRERKLFFIVYTRANSPQHLSLNAGWGKLLSNFFNWKRVDDSSIDENDAKKIEYEFEQLCKKYGFKVSEVVEFVEGNHEINSPSALQEHISCITLVQVSDEDAKFFLENWDVINTNN